LAGYKLYVVLAELVAIVKDVQTSNLIDEVVFPLRYLHRLASDKDVDANEGPKKTFKDFKPIVLVRQLDYEEGRQKEEIFGLSFV
jgi:hypothetical protein